MYKLVALRFALPTIVIVALVALAIIALAMMTHTHIPGTADGFPV
jgi:hypothetical protein